MTTGKELSVAQCGQVQTLIRKYSKVWSKVPGRTEKVAHSVETGSAHPIRQPTYRIPQAHKAEVVAEMREARVIVPSVSQWSSPIVPVRRKDGSLRICIDYRKLNAVSRMDAYPMPSIDDLLGKAGYLSTLDLAKGYWQVPLSPGTGEKTAFSSTMGLFEFTVMPFSLQGAPATFQRLMDSVVAGLSFCAAYLDDVVREQIHSFQFRGLWPNTTTT